MDTTVIKTDSLQSTSVNPDISQNTSKTNTPPLPIKDKDSYKMLWDPVENANWTFSLKYIYPPPSQGISTPIIDGFTGTLL